MEYSAEKRISECEVEMRIKTNLNKNIVTIMLDDGFKIILTYDVFQELKKLISECEAVDD